MSQALIVKSKTTSKSEEASVIKMHHGISLSLAAGAGSSNDLATQGDLTFRRSKRFKSKVLPYWDFERIANLPTSDGNKTVIARDVPGEGTIILQELQPSGAVEPSVKVEPSETNPENLAKIKPTKRKKASQDESIESTHLTGLPSKRSSLSSIASNSTPNKTRFSGSPKKRRLFSLSSSNFLEEQANVVNEECHASGKPARQSRRVYKDKENSFSTHLKILKSKKSGRSSKNIKKSSTSSSTGRLPSLDDPGYSTGNDSLNSTMVGSKLRFVKITGSKKDDSAATGEYSIGRGVVKDDISVFFIHLSKGYLAFRTPQKMVFVGMAGEGYLKLVIENKPSVKTILRYGTEVRADKDAVVAIGCQEGCSTLIVVVVTLDDRDTNGRTSSNPVLVTRGSV